MNKTYLKIWIVVLAESGEKQTNESIKRKMREYFRDTLNLTGALRLLEYCIFGCMIPCLMN